MDEQRQRFKARQAVMFVILNNKTTGDWLKKLRAYVTDDELTALINRRRRQILVHSIIYYKLDDNLISDSDWSELANELDTLQKAFPDIASKCVYAKEFKNFDPCSGYSLPLNDPWAVGTARHLLWLRDLDKEREKYGLRDGE